ncbi:MAG: hypothetical protein J07HX5_01534 [halophilic archaeon J07HX5]|nr:MAG: hypothetical protein J07HX5_01534 [halophilic archaeon J07HX5]
MSRKHSRRAILAGGASAVLGGLAGCLGQGDDSGEGDRQNNTVDTGPGDTGSGSSDPASAQVSFRDWLVAPELTPGVTGNEDRVYRFEYIPGGFLQQAEQDRVQGRASVLDIDPAVIEGRLLQLPAVVYFGEFDQPALETAIESADGYTVTGEYESYRTAENTETGTQFALDEQAVLIGRALEQWIDTQTGTADRLEGTTPVFTQLFDRVPTNLSVTGQLGPPVTFEADLDSLTAWVSATPRLTAGEAVTQRWVYVFDGQPPEDATQAIRQELSDSPLLNSITNTTTDGRFLTVTGELLLPESNSADAAD